jgi:citrate synthase
MSSRKRSTMKATVAPCAGGLGAARSFRPARARPAFPLVLTAAFDTSGASDIVLQSSYTHLPHAGSDGIGREGNAMLIGKPGAARTAISVASSNRIVVRGRDLANDLMGRANFTDYVFLLATGRAPTDEQRFFLDLSLVALAEHGLTPSVQAARMTYDADPAALQGAIAAGVLGCGTVILGAADLCRKLIENVLARVDRCGSLEVAALDVAREHRNERKPLPGYGHPLHKPVDPRAERMIALARERGIAGRSVEAALALTKAAAETWGKPLPMNVSMSIAATLRDVDVPSGLIRAAPILARTAGLIAHCIEEAETPIGFLMASKGEEAVLHVADADGAPA